MNPSRNDPDATRARNSDAAMKAVFADCRAALPGWAGLSESDCRYQAPKGFSSFTISVEPLDSTVDPPAVLFRRLEGKENAILEREAERDVFLTLGKEGIAAHCYFYGERYRLEEFYRGRALTAADLRVPEVLEGIAAALARFHRLRPASVPDQPFFSRLHQKWGGLARRVLEDQRHLFPAAEQALCEPLREIYGEATREKVARCIPEGPLLFCHNDTYHGNIMRLDHGEIRLVDFEFSCLNHPAFDFANLFAETVVRHKQPEYPYFRIAEPEFGEREIATLVGHYLDHAPFETAAGRAQEQDRLVRATQDMILLSDYMYAMAALPLAVDPIQRIRFLPYASQRFERFLRAYEARFGT